MNIRDIEGVNLDRDLRQYKLDERFVCYEPGGQVSEAMSFPDAQRLAISAGDQACVGFLVEEPAAALVAVDYSKPLPAILSRRKQKAHSVS